MDFTWRNIVLSPLCAATKLKSGSLQIQCRYLGIISRVFREPSESNPSGLSGCVDTVNAYHDSIGVSWKEYVQTSCGGELLCSEGV